MTQNQRVLVSDTSSMLGQALVRATRRAGLTPIGSQDASAASTILNEKPETVMMCSGRTGGIHMNLAAPATLMLDNMAHIVEIFRAAHQANVQTLIYFASSCCYPARAEQPMKEDGLWDGAVEATSAPYATAKRAGIRACMAYSAEHQRRFIAVIPGDMYGPGDDFDPRSSHVAAALLRRMHEAKLEGSPEVTVWGSGTPKRDFTFVDDVANGAFALVQGPAEGGTVVNLGSGKGTSIRELAEATRAAVGLRAELVFDSSKPDGMPLKMLDSSRAAGLGWSAMTSLTAGLERTYAWYRETQQS